MSQATQEPAYLLRFDDICPTMNWRIWDRVEAILVAEQIRPLLALVPDNQDPKLMVEPASEGFWSEARGWQQRGWTIALHGYQHLYVSRNRGLVGRRALSEFAGLPEVEQRSKIKRGIEILSEQGLDPTVWAAPGHSFDRATVSVLGEAAIHTISDGFSCYPHRDAQGTFWIPQQLWFLRPAPPGVWTVCYHINEWGKPDLRRFQADVASWRDKMTAVAEVLHCYGQRPGGWWERMVKNGLANYWLLRLRLKLGISVSGGSTESC